MTNNTNTFRMRLRTYRRIRQNFKAEREETVANYFDRLSKKLNYFIK